MNTQTTDPTELAETVEAEMMHGYESQAPEPARQGLGIATARIGGGVVLAASNDPYKYWNKALGFGFAEPVTRSLMDQVVGFYREHGAPMAVIQIAPSVLPEDWDEISAIHGLQAGGHWAKLAAPIQETRANALTDLRVGPVEPSDAAEWASAVNRSFGMYDERVDTMIAQSVHNPATRPFAAWDGDQIVAGANLYLHGSVASLNSGATLPTHRRRGAQSALIAARLEAAREAGAAWVVGEAVLPEPGQSNPSLDNQIKAGLAVRYHRQNWIWTA
ncbi:GNAT family N-acetyltransferase [Promicromonospora sp. NFX87]|uniref:GNAT family N-acetyltransferase n=1 Tax=Promicromonospora sp. NFX87 TaxID=3402691 RepID=UPI003AFB6AE1